MRLIAASGRTPVTIGELADGIYGRRPLPARPVAVTIDDAYEDTPRAVAESLANGLSVTVYVTTGTLDRPGMLLTSQLRALAAIGPKVELGAHRSRILAWTRSRRPMSGKSSSRANAPWSGS